MRALGSQDFGERTAVLTQVHARPPTPHLQHLLGREVMELAIPKTHPEKQLLSLAARKADPVSGIRRGSVQRGRTLEVPRFPCTSRAQRHKVLPEKRMDFGRRGNSGNGFRIDLLFRHPTSGIVRLVEVKTAKRIREVFKIQAALCFRFQEQTKRLSRTA